MALTGDKSLAVDEFMPVFEPWLEIGRIQLWERDKRILETPDSWLNDNHISAVDTILKRQYPKQNGLQSTQQLAKKLKWRSSPADFVQIILVSQNHWVCASNMLSSPGVVEVFDSMPAVVTSTLTTQIAAIIKHKEPEFRLRFINVQHQSGGSDCGLFAIASAVALCAGMDPHSCSYDQQSMRSHLLQCLEKQELSTFPAASKPIRHARSRVKLTRTVRVYCVCRQPWCKASSPYGDLAKCDQCGEWFHQRCANVPDIVYRENNQSWFCSVCSS